MNAEHFIKSENSTFTFAYNPFNKDIHGADVEMGDLKFTKVLKLKPDLTTLRQSALATSGAFVLADPVDVSVAPRTILKNSIKDSTLNVDPQIEMAITFGLTKFKQDEANPSPTESGLLT